MPGGGRRLRAALVALVVALLVGWPAAAARADAGEQVTSFDAQLQLDQSGDLHVTETIAYRFAGNEHHGLERDLRTVFDAPDDKVREYPVSDVRATSPSGASADVHESHRGALTVIRLGDPSKTVEGEQTYRLQYVVKGAVNRVDGDTSLGSVGDDGDRVDGDGASVPPHDELFWNVTGNEWEAPIQRVSISVTGPGAVSRVACYQGPKGSTQECPASKQGGTARFSAGQQDEGSGVTVVLAYPHGAVANPGPILEDRSDVEGLDSGPAAIGDSLHRLSALDLGGAAALFAVLIGGTGLLVRARGRDAVYDGLTPGLLPVAGQVVGTRTVTRQPKDVAVQFTPPAGVTAGLAGVVEDEQADMVDVTATIIDLAVRGYLRIEQLPKQTFKKQDWRLDVVRPAPPVEQLLPYELTLLQALFAGRDSVDMSALRNTFARSASTARKQLVEEATARGWFRGNPQQVAGRWRLLGVACSVVGFGLVVVGGWSVDVRTLFGVTLVVAGFVVTPLARRMVARTADGSAMLAQVSGFRQYLTTAEAGQIRFEEATDVFSRYLPYAIVFGVAERWAKVFDDLARAAAAAGQAGVVSYPGWYVGTAAGWDFGGFARDVGSFATVASTTLTSTPGSSGSSGFSGGSSGGGGGGGGGGSW